MGYSRQHLVVFEESGDIKRRHLNITFRSDPSNKAVLVRLTDENDLYFLYCTCISVEEFSQIKIQQGLLVDFTGFGQKVIDLLAMCLSEETSVNPKYILKFVRGGSLEDQCGQLKIIEATNFKYLTHLSLDLRAADDATLKSHLVGQLNTLKTESQEKISELQQALSTTKARLQSAEESLNSSNLEISQMDTERKQREVDLKHSFNEEIKQLQDKILSLETQHHTNIMRERRLADEMTEKVRLEMCEQINKLSSEKQDGIRSHDNLQSSMQHLTSQLTKVEEKYKCVMEELEATRSRLTVVEQLKQEQSSAIERLSCRNNELEQELETKEKLLVQSREELCAEQARKSQLTRDLQHHSKQLEDLEQSSEKNSEEVKKANEIIKHLQTEVKSHHNKAKLRGQVAAEQERLLTSKDAELQEKITELNRTRTRLTEATNEVNRLTMDLKEATSELGEAQKTIKTNENIISWLNRQISEKQLGNLHNRLKTVGYSVSSPSNGTHIRPTSPPQNTVIPSDSSLIPPWQPTTSFPKTAALHNVIVNKLHTTTPSMSSNDAPQSKSSALHAEFTLPRPMDSNKTSNITKFPSVPLPILTHTSKPLPVYVPSSIPPIKVTAANNMNLLNSVSTRNNFQPNLSANEMDGNVNQNSLPSAYFPKHPLGAHGQS